MRAFFAYMNFFVFAMLTLVLSDNFVGLLVGWGLVGLASYFLIGFWFERPSAVAAARKAFVINVVGDVGDHVRDLCDRRDRTLDRIRRRVSRSRHATVRGLLFAICVGLFIGAAAKSAQIPLHTWLPDAMEGPTPVSALDPRRDDGHRGRLSDRALRAAVERQPERAAAGRFDRRPDRARRRDPRHARSGTSSAFWPTRRCRRSAT